MLTKLWADAILKMSIRPGGHLHEKSIFSFVITGKTSSIMQDMACARTTNRPRNRGPSKASFGSFLSFIGHITDDQGNVIGCRFEGDAVQKVYPDNVYSILSATCVDDDGCPEEVSIWHYIQLIPCSE